LLGIGIVQIPYRFVGIGIRPFRP